VTGPDLLLHHLKRKVVSAPLGGLADGDLLRRFAAGGADAEAAFEVLVRRHGPMILRVCRSALGDAHAADDAFQAAFLVLVRRAGAVGCDGCLGPWLFQVARRVCGHARVVAARRARHEARFAERLADQPDGLDPDVAAAVHAEVGRLPERLRAAVVVCDLAGLTYQEAADRLGISHATVRGRLARAREKLRQRLVQRGIGPDAVWAVPVAVPAALAGATARAAAVAAGRAAGEVPAAVLELVSGGMSMVFTKLKAAGLSSLAAVVLIAGAVGLTAQTIAPTPPPAVTSAQSAYSPEGTPQPGMMGVVRDRDAGDEVAALVRQAQRLQDRGDLAGAKRTLGRVDDALKAWTDQLDKATHRDPATAASDFYRFSGVQRITPTAPKQADLEGRLREVEAKLDRLLREMERQRTAGPTGERRN
jgi:RNA polymerase sigma factor (sigma-70 family)